MRSASSHPEALARANSSWKDVALQIHRETTTEVERLVNDRLRAGYVVRSVNGER
jgi:hypothetical protein